MVRCSAKTQKGGRCKNSAMGGCKNCALHRGKRGGGGSYRKTRRNITGGGLFGWSNVATQERDAARNLREQAKVAKQQAQMFERARRQQIREKIGQDLGEIKTGVQQKARSAFGQLKQGADYIGQKAQKLEYNLGQMGRRIDQRFKDGKETFVTEKEKMTINSYISQIDKLNRDLRYINQDLQKKDAEIRRLCAKPRHQQLQACYNYLNHTL